MNLKDMLNQVLLQSGFLKKAEFVGTEDPDDLQMVAIANRVIYEMYNFYPWNQMRVSYTLNLTDEEEYDLPDDYQSYIPDSAWETDGSRKVDVPVSDNEWYQYKFSSLTTAGVIRARFYGDKIQVIDPVSGQEFSFEYISKYPIVASTSERKEFFSSDLDGIVLDDQVFILGVQAHWMQTKMMPQYMEHMVNYRTKMNEAIGRTNAAQTIGGRKQQGRRSPYTPLWKT